MLIDFVPYLWLKIDLVFFWIVKDKSLGLAQNVKLSLVSGLSKTKNETVMSRSRLLQKISINAIQNNLLNGLLCVSLFFLYSHFHIPHIVPDSHFYVPH